MNQSSKIKKLLKKIIRELESMKAKDVMVIDINSRSAIGDYLVIATGNSSRHINSIVSMIIKRNKNMVISTEGIKSTDWSIVDFGDIVLNVFKLEARKHYALEKIWQNGISDDKQGFG
jgi:ribosome-associated protein